MSLLAMLLTLWGAPMPLRGPPHMGRVEESRQVTQVMSGGDTFDGGNYGTIQLALPTPNVGQRWDVSSITLEFYPYVGASNYPFAARTHVVGPDLALIINGSPIVLAVPLTQYSVTDTPPFKTIWAIQPSDGDPLPAQATVNYASGFTILPRDSVIARLQGGFAGGGGGGSPSYNFNLRMTARMIGVRSADV